MSLALIIEETESSGQKMAKTKRALKNVYMPCFGV